MAGPKRQTSCRLAGRFAGAALALAALLAAAPAPAQSPPVDGTGTTAATTAKGRSPLVVLRADEATYDQNTGIVTARGKVEIAHAERILRADEVIYDEKNDKVTAIGNVVLLEPTGEVEFAERAEFSDSMREGWATGFRMLLTDNSRLAAARGTRTGGIITNLDKAVYSPCNLCKEDPKRPPLWRLRSVRVTHDSEAKDVEHRDAYLEMFGVPVFYTPYLSHPDPSVKRRSGFLAPEYGSDSDFGYVLKVPYFWELSPSEDVTITPQLMSEQGDVLGATYRRRFANAEVEIDGSGTNPYREDNNGNRTGGSDTRGHLFAKGRVHHDEIWRTKFQFQHASDDTYLRRYKFPMPEQQTLTTSFNTEGFQGRNYAQFSGYSFQGLRATDDPGRSPLVLPYAEYNYVSRPAANGAFLTADTSLLAINRDQSTDSRRVAFNGGWHLPYKAWTGEVYRLSATMRADMYHVDDVSTGDGSLKSGGTGRAMPQVMAEWRYPFVKPESGSSQLIEPVAAVAVAPNGGNPSKIPNEDSRDLEFDDTNLFSPNRFTGSDRVEGGTRFMYGLNWGLYGDKGGAVEAFAGQSLRLRPQNDFSETSGLRDETSDVVGRLRVSPGSWLDFLYRFRFDTEDSSARRHQVSTSFGPTALKFGLSYLYLDETGSTTEFGDREEVALSAVARLTTRWQANAAIHKNLADNGGTVSEGFGLTYTDECFTFIARATRNFSTDRDLRPTDSLMFMFIFKNLGEFTSRG